MQKDKILELSSYITELKIDNDNNLIYIGVSFPNVWFVVDLLTDLASDTINFTSITGKQNAFYLWTNIENGYDELLNVINNIVQINKQNEFKANLFSEKINKLKEFFDDNSITIEELQTIDFKIKRRKKYTKPIKNIIDDNTKTTQNDNNENNENVIDGNN